MSCGHRRATLYIRPSDGATARHERAHLSPTHVYLVLLLSSAMSAPTLSAEKLTFSAKVPFITPLEVRTSYILLRMRYNLNIE